MDNGFFSSLSERLYLGEYKPKSCVPFSEIRLLKLAISFDHLPPREIVKPPFQRKFHKLGDIREFLYENFTVVYTVTLTLYRHYRNVRGTLLIKLGIMPHVVQLFLSSNILRKEKCLNWKISLSVVGIGIEINIIRVEVFLYFVYFATTKCFNSVSCAVKLISTFSRKINERILIKV